MKLKTASKDTINRVKRQFTDQKNYLQITYLIRELYPEYIKNFYNCKKMKKLNQNMVKGENIYFSKEDIKIANKHMKIYWTSLGQCTWKPQWDTTSYLQGWLKLKKKRNKENKKKKTSVDGVNEDREKVKCPYTVPWAGMIVRWWSHFGKLPAIPQNVKYRIAI